MKIDHVPLALLCIAPVLSGCSTPEPATTMQIKPVLQVAHSGSDAQGLYQLGRYYQAQDRLELAEQAYRKALALHADYVDAHSALGALYARQSKFDDAIAEFNAVLRTSPELAQVYNNLGYTYYLQGKLDDAVSAYEKALALEPRNARAFNNLAAALEKRGQPAAAQQARARAVALQAPEVMTRPAGQPQALPALASGPAVSLPPASRAAEASLPPIAPLQAEAAPTASLKPFRFQIANGNGVSALAKRFRDAFIHQGLPASRLSNLKPYQQAQTVIEYREGYREAALQVSARFANAPVLTRNEVVQDGIDVRLVLGKDVTTLAALRQPERVASVAQVAQAD